MTDKNKTITSIVILLIVIAVVVSLTIGMKSVVDEAGDVLVGEPVVPVIENGGVNLVDGNPDIRETTDIQETEQVQGVNETANPAEETKMQEHGG